MLVGKIGQSDGARRPRRSRRYGRFVLPCTRCAPGGLAKFSPNLAGVTLLPVPDTATPGNSDSSQSTSVVVARTLYIADIFHNQPELQQQKRKQSGIVGAFLAACCCQIADGMESDALVGLQETRETPTTAEEERRGWEQGGAKSAHALGTCLSLAAHSLYDDDTTVRYV